MSLKLRLLRLRYHIVKVLNCLVKLLLDLIFTFKRQKEINKFFQPRCVHRFPHIILLNTLQTFNYTGLKTVRR